MVNTKSQKVWGLIVRFVEVSGEKQSVRMKGGRGRGELFVHSS